MLNKLSPFFAIIFSYFLLKEKIQPYQLICVITAFIGALFILRPGFDSVATLPAFIGMIGGMGAGLAYTNVRIASKHGAPGPLIVFCFSVFSCLCAVPFIIVDHQPLACGSWHPFDGGTFATLDSSPSRRLIPMRRRANYPSMIIRRSSLLPCLASSSLGKCPDVISILGYLIICGAGIVMFLIRKKKEA